MTIPLTIFGARAARLALFLLAAIAANALPAAEAKRLDNVDSAGIALQGYDPVAFFTMGKAVAGDPAIHASHEGATYRFASAEHRAAFEKEPARYRPAFGGWCALGVAYGGLYPVRIDTWQILDGRLVLNKNLEVKAEFDKDRKGNLARADGNWPRLLQTKGK